MKKLKQKNAQKIKFLNNTTTVFLSYISTTNPQCRPIRHNTTSLPKIDKKEKIEQIKKIKTINQKEMKRKIKIKTINKKYQMKK